MKIDVHGEEALDLFAELIEPAAEIMADKDVVEAARGSNKARAVKVAIKAHKPAVIAILAALNGQTPEEYADKMTIFTLPVEAMRLLNDPMVQSLFTSQGQKTEDESSGSVTEGTKASEN